MIKVISGFLLIPFYLTLVFLTTRIWVKGSQKGFQPAFMGPLQGPDGYGLVVRGYRYAQPPAINCVPFGDF